MARIALVTGANKGIGYAMVRNLSKNFEGHVYLTARDEGRGRAAVQELAKEGCTVKFHQLDINEQASVDKLAAYVKSTYSGLDVLVNNAGVAYKRDATAPFGEQAEVTMATNFWGRLRVCDALFPLLKPNARVVHVSSHLSRVSFNQCSDDIKKRIKDCKTIDDVKALMSEFVAVAKDGDVKAKGWTTSAYGMSKIGVSAITSIQQAAFDKDSRQGIIVNSCCPGHVATDMSSHTGPKTTDEGADTACYLALLPAGATEPRGLFVHERKVEEWAPL